MSSENDMSMNQASLLNQYLAAVFRHFQRYKIRMADLGIRVIRQISRWIHTQHTNSQPHGQMSPPHTLTSLYQQRVRTPIGIHQLLQMLTIAVKPGQ